MTEERARHYAETLAQSMGITFYVVHNSEGRFLAVQIPSEGYEIVATVTPAHERSLSAPTRRERWRAVERLSGTRSPFDRWPIRRTEQCRDVRHTAVWSAPLG